MHFVCSLYASPTAYIFMPSALRTRLFSFLYALYAVNSGVMFPHSVHSRFFDAYNAYSFFDRPSERRNGRIAYMPAETHDDREARMGRDGGGRRGRVRGKPWGAEPGREDLRAGRIGAGTHMADTRSPGKRLNPGDKRKLTRTRHPSGVGEYSSILESGRSGNILGDLS